MFYINLKVFFRSILNKPVYSIISIAGFTLGIAASLFILLLVLDELSYEQFHPGHERIYRVLTLSIEGDQPVKSSASYPPTAQYLKSEFPQVEDAIWIYHGSENSPLKTTDKPNRLEFTKITVSDSFFNFFKGFKFIEGDPETALDDPNKIVLAKHTAHKLFGQESVLGKRLISDKYSWENLYTVGGVVEIPPNSHITFDYLLSEKSEGHLSSNNWNRKSNHTVTYIKLKKNIVIDDNFRRKASGLVSKYSKNTDKLLFQPLDDIHLYTDYDTYKFDKNLGHYKYVWIFLGLAMLIILMASFNFASLTTVRASERAIEIGVKKVVGSHKKGLAIQFIAESIIQTFFASIVSLLLIGLILPWFNNLTGRELALIFTPWEFYGLVLYIIIIGLLSGIYSALYLTSLKPLMILKRGNPLGTKGGLLKGLVLLQFTITIILLVCTGVIFKQMQFIQKSDLGIDKNNVVVIPTGLWYSIGSFKQELLKNPNVVSVSAGSEAMLDYVWSQKFQWNEANGTDSLQAHILWVDEDFASTYGLKILKGDFINFDYKNYWRILNKNAHNRQGTMEENRFAFPVVINETFMKRLGIADPIGLRLNKSNVIIGVIQDFHYRPLHHKIGPLVLTNNPESILTCHIKIRPKNQQETLAFISDTYQKFRGVEDLSFHFFEDRMEQFYSAEYQLGKIILIFCLLAIIIAMLGIFGLSAFATGRRVKEVGIRKINGAKVSQILVMLNKDFVKWVVIAFIIACPIAYFAMSKWLENFAYKTTLSWWIFALAGALALGIALLTVSWQSWRAATRNPIESLRYE